MTLRQTAILLLFLPVVAYAERFSEHRVEAGLRAGLAGWDSERTYVNMQPNVHGGVEVAYAYFSPYFVCGRAGVTADIHRAGFGRHNFEDSYPEPNQRMEIEYVLGNLRETYTTYSVGVPLQIGVRWQQLSFFIGPKIAFTVTDSASWKATVKRGALSVYYPDYDNRVYESYPLAATRHFELEEKGRCALVEPMKMEWWLAMEFNYTLYLNTTRNHHSFLVFGLYADYAFTGRNIKAVRGDERSLVTLTLIQKPFVPLQREYNTVLGSYRNGRRLVGEQGNRLFDVGIRIAYAIAPFDRHKANPYKCNCL